MFVLISIGLIGNDWHKHTHRGRLRVTQHKVKYTNSMPTILYKHYWEHSLSKKHKYFGGSFAQYLSGIMLSVLHIIEMVTVRSGGMC